MVSNLHLWSSLSSILKMGPKRATSTVNASELRIRGEGGGGDTLCRLEGIKSTPSSYYPVAYCDLT